MTMAGITIKGVDAAVKKLGKAAAIKTLQAPMQRSVMRLQRDMAEYPTQRPGSAYRRTGTLGRRWITSVSRKGGGLVGKVGNNTTYGPFVQSSQFQARVHRGRWQTDADVMDRNKAAIEADFARAIREAMK